MNVGCSHVDRLDRIVSGPGVESRTLFRKLVAGDRGNHKAFAAGTRWRLTAPFVTSFRQMTKCSAHPSRKLFI